MKIMKTNEPTRIIVRNFVDDNQKLNNYLKLTGVQL